MRIDDVGVGQLHTGEALTGRLDKERRSPIGGVDVKPEPVIVGHLPHPGEVVHDAGIGRPGGADDGDDVSGRGIGRKRRL